MLRKFITNGITVNCRLSVRVLIEVQLLKRGILLWVVSVPRVQICDCSGQRCEIQLEYVIDCGEKFLDSGLEKYLCLYWNSLPNRLCIVGAPRTRVAWFYSLTSSLLTWSAIRSMIPCLWFRYSFFLPLCSIILYSSTSVLHRLKQVWENNYCPAQKSSERLQPRVSL